jgi:hypothetical protein
MSRKFLIPLLAAAFLAAPAFAPATMTDSPGSAQAKTKTKKTGISTDTNRMGGGGGKKAAPAARMGGGGGHSVSRGGDGITGGANKSIKLNSGRSNLY